MRASDIVRLFSLAAIWGGSFIFIRVLAPVLGPVATACFRVLIAGCVLSLYFKIIKFEVGWKEHWKHYFLIGVVNSALPFLFYSFAALHLPASLMVILNSSSPLFGALLGALWLGESLTLKKILGLLLGVGGVCLVAIKGAVSVGEFGLIAVLSCLAAAICYALAGIYIKKFAPNLKPLAVAGASQLAAGISLAPFIALSPIKGVINSSVVLNVLGLAILCSAIAYVLYYRLIADIGPTKSLTVTFLMPAFGLAWGMLFLSEVVTLQMILGCLLIIGGTTLVLNLRFGSRIK